MAERRKAPRRRVLKAGKIEFDGSAIDCGVRDLTDLGAALDVATPVGIPDRFTLVIPVNHLRFACRVVWLKPTRIGVRFD
jgi:PilZ domain-containing protein